MTRILIDSEKCDCFANCVVTAPDLFTIGDEGKAVPLVDVVLESQLDAAQEAVRECPVAAIRLVE